MSKVRSLTNRFIVFLFVLLTGARVAVARVWPFHPPAAKPPAPNVFALTQGEWMALRAMDGTQDSQTPDSVKGTTHQKPKSTEKKPATAPATKQQKTVTDDKKQQPHPDAKQGEKKTAKPKPGVGGGDGDMDGGGG